MLKSDNWLHFLHILCILYSRRSISVFCSVSINLYRIPCFLTTYDEKGAFHHDTAKRSAHTVRTERA